VTFEANLSNVLDGALTWDKEQKGDAIVLLAASDAYTNISKANAFIKSIEGKHTTFPPIHIIDYNDLNTPYFFNNGYYYYGNEYLYTYLTQKTAGNYAAWRITNGSYYITKRTFLDATTSIMAGLAETLKNIDIYTSPENGYCYSRYSFNNANLFLANKTLLQTGKYEGNLPLNIQVAGAVGEQSFFKKISVAETEMVTVDSSLKQIWTGAYLAESEFKTTTSNATIKEMLNISKKNRVLSQYTAFLALEPGVNQTVPCVKCNDETKIITTAINDETSKDSIFIKTYPNPFREKVTLEITANNNKETQASIAIFDLTGKMLYEDQQAFDSEKAIFVWNEDAPKGMYLAQIKVGTKKHSIKLMKIE
jgi:Secretion system C-terminal sorting domain